VKGSKDKCIGTTYTLSSDWQPSVSPSPWTV